MESTEDRGPMVAPDGSASGGAAGAQWSSITMGSGLALATLLALTINLRPVISSVSPLTPDIQSSLDLSKASIGVITTIPILCMGVIAPMVPRLAARWGRMHVVTTALALLTLGTASRLLSANVPAVLWISALIAGIGVAMGAGLAPSFVREWFPSRVPSVTGMYSSSMILGAAIAGAATVPIAHVLDSWPLALAAWALPTGLALILWLIMTARNERRLPTPVTASAPHERPARLPWRNPVALALAAYLGCNGFVFYSVLAWMAPSYNERGWGQAEAGYLMAVCISTQIIGALFVPKLVSRFRERRWAYAGSALLSAVGLIVIGVAPGWLPLLWTVLTGIGQGAAFSLGLTLLSEYGETPQASARLTGLGFLVSYLCSAAGPVIMGGFIGATGSWIGLYVVLCAVCVGQAVLALPLRRGIRIA